MVCDLLNPPPKRTLASPAARAAVGITRDEFLNWHPEPTGLKYEWKQGEVLFGEDSMNQKESGIINVLTRRLANTKSFQEGGNFFAETDCYLAGPDCVRRPDLAYFTSAQIKDSALEVNPVPAFVIEIVSKNDEMNHHEEKLRDYFAVGVQVVWHILPQFRAVRIYRSLGEMSLAIGATPCSAAPVLTDFAPVAEELFIA